MGIFWRDSILGLTMSGRRILVFRFSGFPVFRFSGFPVFRFSPFRPRLQREWARKSERRTIWRGRALDQNLGISLDSSIVRLPARALSTRSHSGVPRFPSGQTPVSTHRNLGHFRACSSTLGKITSGASAIKSSSGPAAIMTACQGVCKFEIMIRTRSKAAVGSCRRSDSTQSNVQWFSELSASLVASCHSNHCLATISASNSRYFDTGNPSPHIRNPCICATHSRRHHFLRRAQ